MPSKHIKQVLWEQVEALTVAAVKETDVPLSTSDVLEYVVIKGLMMADPAEMQLLQKLSIDTTRRAIESKHFPKDKSQK